MISFFKYHDLIQSSAKNVDQVGIGEHFDCQPLL